VDPTGETGFPLTVMAILPFLLLHYDDPTTLCVQASKLIAEVTNYFMCMYIFNQLVFVGPFHESDAWSEIRCVSAFGHSKQTFLLFPMPNRFTIGILY